jgi:hypothetical protein
MTQKLLSDPERLLALEAAEKKIFQAFRRGLDASRIMGTELRKIHDQELFTAKMNPETGEPWNWTGYVFNVLGWDVRSTNRILNIAGTVDRLEDAQLKLPDNESQVAELARLKEPEAQLKVWEKVVRAAEYKDWPITVSMVRVAVENEEGLAAAKKLETKARGLEPPLNVEDGDGQEEEHEEEVPDRIRLTEKGEGALERIGRLCGPSVKEAIEHFKLDISEKDIIKWSEQTDRLVKNLAHYVCNVRMSVARAIAYDQSGVDGATTVEKLVTLARAAGGSTQVRHDDAVITVEIEKKAVV